MTDQILNANTNEGLEEFKKAYINHTKLKSVMVELKSSFPGYSEDTIALVMGPTGVGKSTAKNEFMKYLLDFDKRDNPGTVPYLEMTLTSPGKSQVFDWIDFYKKGLYGLHEPVIDFKIDYQTRNINRKADGRIDIQKGTTERELRTAYINCLHHRRPLAVLLDEGQHLKKTVGARSLVNQMDAIKSLCIDSKTPHILFGTYELLDLVDLSEQLSRRSQYIHIPRYKAVPNDYENFLKVVMSFQGKIQLESETQLIQHGKYLYKMSAGLVGILKEWLDRAYSFAIVSGENTITLETLEKMALKSSQVAEIARNISEGERLFAQMENQGDLIESLLGISCDQPNRNPANKASQPVQPRPKPGTRNPKRDPVGNDTLSAISPD